MAEEKPERLGVKGTLALFESALRLLGAANATGFLATGAAFHAFGSHPALTGIAAFFLLGLVTFMVEYGAWFFINLDLDRAFQKSKDDPRLDALFPRIKKKSAEDILKGVRRSAGVMYMTGLFSFVFFGLGLLLVAQFVLSLE
jgi:hypothetical protein